MAFWFFHIIVMPQCLVSLFLKFFYLVLFFSLTLFIPPEFSMGYCKNFHHYWRFPVWLPPVLLWKSYVPCAFIYFFFNLPLPLFPFWVYRPRLFFSPLWEHLFNLLCVSSQSYIMFYHLFMDFCHSWTLIFTQTKVSFLFIGFTCKSPYHSQHLTNKTKYSILSMHSI